MLQIGLIGSALGRKRPNRRWPKPAFIRLGPKADKLLRCRECPLCAKTDLYAAAKRILFDRLLGSNERRLAKSSCGGKLGHSFCLTGHSAVGTLEMLNERCFSHKKWVAK